MNASSSIDYRGVSGVQRALRSGGVAVGLLALVVAFVWAGMNLKSAPSPKRQITRIMVLPDTPPPPPVEEKPPPPREQKMEQRPLDAPKQEAPPEPEQLKMEGQAGEGPSAFAAGSVQQDYVGGDIGAGSRYSAYVARLGQQLQEELTRRKLRAGTVKLYLWLRPDGTVERFTCAGGSEAEKAVRLALADFTRANEPPLADMPMPVGLQINLR